MFCPKCKSGNIIGVEIMGAWDWCLEIHCNDCGKKCHRGTWLEIVSRTQPKEYWSAHYELEWWKKAINSYLI